MTAADLQQIFRHEADLVTKGFISEKVDNGRLADVLRHIADKLEKLAAQDELTQARAEVEQLKRTHGDTA